MSAFVRVPDEFIIAKRVASISYFEFSNIKTHL